MPASRTTRVKGVPNPYLTPEDEARIEEAPLGASLADVAPVEAVAPVTEAPAVVPEEPVSIYPIPYYNPRIIDERFYVAGDPYVRRFVKGKFMARDENEEASVRAALAAHGRDKPDRWKGDDGNGTIDPRRTEFVCKRTGFRTFNDLAKEDYEIYHPN